MDEKCLEIFELKYRKIINSSKIMYKTLASYNDMAFSLKKMLKETDLYVQSLVVLSLIRSNELSLGFLNALSGIGEYADPFKKLKIKKVKELDDKLISKIKLIAEDNLKIEPLFIKVAAFFDKITAKYDSSNDIKGCNIIEECLLTMLLLVRNIDDKENLNKYQKDIEIIYNYIKR